ncbi:MAG: YraN family protein [Campylobacteraceae bacterium]|nr:YraN family protein [Campylobacteraceae bacterium]
MLEFGLSGEKKAVKFLKKQHLEILQTNFHSRFGEIDIIAKDKDILHFIEVKTSKNYDPLDRITPQKFQKILKTIDYYMYQNPNQYDYQIDAILVRDDKIEWIQNISF